MRLQKRYLRGKSKRRSTRCCGVQIPPPHCRLLRLFFLASLGIAVYKWWPLHSSNWLSHSGSADHSTPDMTLIKIGDYPGLLQARHEHRDDPEPSNLWTNPQNQTWQHCDLEEPYQPERLPPSTGYIQLFLDGGLNQLRIGICNAVAVAKILNATLLIPEFQVNAVWLDQSKFGEIFDEEYFIQRVSEDIRVVRHLPESLAWSTREHYATGVHGSRIRLAPLHAPAEWYISNVLPKLRKYHVVAIAPFTHRLGFDSLPLSVQRLRCRVNFHYLRFVPPILRLGHTLVSRLRDPSRAHTRHVTADMAAYSKNHSSPGTSQSELHHL